MCQGEWKLTLVVIGAKNLDNVSTFGKLDPYVRVIYGNSVYRSTTLKDGGCSPIWNYEICITGYTPTVRIEVMDSRMFRDRFIGFAEINLMSLTSNCEMIACNLHSSKDPNRCCGVLLTKISIFEANGGPCAYPTPCWTTPQRSFTFPLTNPPSVPAVHSAQPSIVMSCCCCYRNGRPTVATASLPPVNPQFANPYCGRPNQPVIQRRVSTDACSRNFHVNRTPSMTPEMFPIIPDPALS